MQHWYRDIISGEAAGAVPAILRAVFSALAFLYKLVIGLRNELYDNGVLKSHRLPVPVISVGNITTGGTGKTPTTILIVQELVRMGRRPAVLTRGYGARKGERPDEAMVIEQECPGVPVVVNPDRVAGGRHAIDAFGADVLVLDDGFQHRRLARDLNVVLVDATEPMGIGGMLPRGTWREPPHTLRRANVIMLTRCEQVSEELADLAAGLLTQWVPPRHIFQQRTRVLGLYDGQNNAVPVDAQRVVAFAGIGNPTSFLNTLRALGLRVSAACWFGDHHAYALPDDLAPLARLCHDRDIGMLVTTLKDWVKLRGSPSPVPILHVRITAELPPTQAAHWRDLLARTVQAKVPSPVPPPVVSPVAPPYAPPPQPTGTPS